MIVVRWLCRLHDALSDAGYIAGVLGLASMVVIYCYEVVTRYFLNLATDWANDAFANILCVTIFSMVPHATRRGLHISISLLVEMVPRLDRTLAVVTGILGFVVCLFLTWMSLEANIRQVVEQIVTEQNYPVPKIWMSSFITFGFAGAALYFLRSLFPVPDVQPVSWVTPDTQTKSTAG